MSGPPAPPSTGRGRLTLLVGAAGAAVLVAVAALAFSGAGSGRASGVTDPEAFDLPALQGGGRVRLDDFRGRPVVVNLFASWCAECEKELPAFARASADLRGRVQFVGVNSEETGDGRGMATRYHLADNGFALARDINGGNGSGLHDALKAPGMPVTVFYDANGKILVRDVVAVSDATLRDTLRRLYGA